MIITRGLSNWYEMKNEHLTGTVAAAMGSAECRTGSRRRRICSSKMPSEKMSPTCIATTTTKMMGTASSMLLVASSRITDSESVMRVTPATCAAAPSSAYFPGFTLCNGTARGATMRPLQGFGM